MIALSLLGAAGGVAARVVPEVFKFFTAKSDRDHEFRMSKLQLEIDQARAKQQIDLVHAQGDVAEVAGRQQAYLEAVKAQGRPTGIRWVDALSATVRPVLTYWWMMLFTTYKATVIYDAWLGFVTWKGFGQQVWVQDDAAVLSGIITFWFTDRVFKSHK